MEAINAHSCSKVYQSGRDWWSKPKYGQHLRDLHDLFLSTPEVQYCVIIDHSTWLPSVLIPVHVYTAEQFQKIVDEDQLKAYIEATRATPCPGWKPPRQRPVQYYSPIFNNRPYLEYGAHCGEDYSTEYNPKTYPNVKIFQRRIVQEYMQAAAVARVFAPNLN